MMKTTTRHSITSASMLGHRFFHKGILPLRSGPLIDRNSDVVAGVASSSWSWPLSLLSSCASSGVCSVVLLEFCDRAERADRDERADFCEAGRELGVRVEPHVASGVSMTVGIQREGKRREGSGEARKSCVGKRWGGSERCWLRAHPVMAQPPPGHPPRHPGCLPLASACVNQKFGRVTAKVYDSLALDWHYIELQSSQAGCRRPIDPACRSSAPPLRLCEACSEPSDGPRPRPQLLPHPHLLLDISSLSQTSRLLS